MNALAMRGSIFVLLENLEILSQEPRVAEVIYYAP